MVYQPTVKKEEFSEMEKRKILISGNTGVKTEETYNRFII